MERLTPASAPEAASSTVLTIGVFDGVHRGHQRTLAQARAAADARGARLVVVTFDPHPLAVLRPEAAPKLLTTLDQRLELLAAEGVDACFILPFNREASLQSATSFVEDLLVDQLGGAEVLVGRDFRFGHNREGDVAFLEAAGDRLGFSVSGIELGEADGAPVSSTRIRSLLGEGEVEKAAELLGRVHESRAEVIHGDGRGGAELGFPTANLGLSSTQVLPGDGIYAGWYRDHHRGPLPAAISVGRRPTFLADAEPIIEAYVLDFEGDLYGEAAGVSFLARLRGEERFDTVQALISQMADDAAAARARCTQSGQSAPEGPIQR